MIGQLNSIMFLLQFRPHFSENHCAITVLMIDQLHNPILQVLSEDETNVKALFRRGKAKAELGQTEAAREDFLKAKKHSPEDKEIMRELRLLAEQDKAMYQKQKELYKGLFGPRPQPKPKTTNPLLVFWQWLVSLISYLAKIFTRKND
jgi:tetratricopeptide (TPR) repeat protein